MLPLYMDRPGWVLPKHSILECHQLCDIGKYSATLGSRLLYAPTRQTTEARYDEEQFLSIQATVRGICDPEINNSPRLGTSSCPQVRQFPTPSLCAKCFLE